MGNNRFMVVSEENGIIAMNPSSTCPGRINKLCWNMKRKEKQETFLTK